MVKRDEFLPERVGGRVPNCSASAAAPCRPTFLAAMPRFRWSVRESSESAIAACPEHENCSPLRSVGGEEGVASL